MIKVHHTQTKLAAKLGLTIKLDDAGTIRLVDKDGAIRFTGTDLKALLEQATKAAAPAKAPRKAKAKAPKRRAARDEDGDEDEDGEAAEDGEEEDEDHSVVKSKYKTKYRAHKNSCGDDVSGALRDATYDDDEDAISIPKLNEVAKANGLSLAKYKGRNRGWEGRLRMTVGNLLRGLLRKGTGVVIGSQKFKALPVKAKTGKA